MFCRWLVRYVQPASGSKRVKLGMEPAPLQRAGALGEEGFRNQWTHDFPPAKSQSRATETSPSAPPKTKKAKKLSAEKKVGKKRQAPTKPSAQALTRVRIPFPPMQAPFGGPKKYDPSKNVATLTLSFQGEAKPPELVHLRQLLTKTEGVMGDLIKLIRPARESQPPISVIRKNTFIRTGKRVSDEVTDRWPDTIPLKMYPESVCFKTADGEILDAENIFFADYDVQPTVELRDVWKVGPTYFPRLVVTECVLHAREIPPPITLPALESSDENEDFADGFGRKI